MDWKEMKDVYWFRELSKNSLSIAGGKGANLGEMYNSNFPIPDGFVVSSGAYYKFIYHNGIDKIIKEYTENLDVEDTDELNKASLAIKNAILRGEIPNEIREAIIESYNKLGTDVYVAVRSSATAEDLPTASFAGQQATFLNISGALDVVQAVKECWASLFEARAIYYRTQNKFDHLKVGLAAVVQLMVESEVSGIMFTVEPVTEDYNTISIEAGYGLGEAIVSGSITPDRYLVDKNTLEIKDKEEVVPILEKHLDKGYLLLISYTFYEELKQDIEEMKIKSPKAVILELPSLSGEVEEEFDVKKLLQAVSGIKI